MRVVRAVLLPVVVASCLVVLLRVTGRHEDIASWACFRYARYWAATALFSAACTSAGHLVVRRLFPRRPLRLGEQLPVAFATGVFLFFLAVDLLGALHLLHAGAFYVIPLSLLGIGAGPTGRYVARAWRHIRRARLEPRPVPGPFRYVAWAFGLLGLLLVYVNVMLPDTLAWDARWYHMPLAENYAASGVIGPSKEGLFFAGYPHLASILYTWAFLLPGSDLFDRIELCRHLEFATFLVTLAMIPALVRRVDPRRRMPYAWAGYFLFPKIWINDSGLCGLADHIAALWSIPTVFFLLRAWRDLNVRDVAMVAAFLAAAANAKYLALIAATGPVLAVAYRAVVISAQERGAGARRVIASLGVATVVGLALTTPFWLRNIVYYGDPFFPLFHHRFPSRFWHEDAAPMFHKLFEITNESHPPLDLAGLREIALAQLDFSFFPRDWAWVHGTSPYFGALYTFALVTAPFVGTRRRVWGLFFSVQIGIATWYAMHHYDRYLQMLLPWMVAATVVVFASAWRAGRVARVAVATLFAAQIAWNGDAPFLETNEITHESAVRLVAHFLSGGFRGDSNRFHRLGDMESVGDALPKNAVVLAHDIWHRLGLQHPSVADHTGTQGGIGYGRLSSPRDVHDLLRGLGVTHVLYDEAEHASEWSAGAEILFWTFVERFTGPAAPFGTLRVRPMPEAPPPVENGSDVAYFGCDKGKLWRPVSYAHGLYPIGAMNVVSGPTPAPTIAFDGTASSFAALVARARYVVHGDGCAPPFVESLRKPFRVVRRRGPDTFYARIAGEPAP